MPRFNYTGHECIFWESRGCVADIEVDQMEHSREQIIYGIETDEFEEQVIALEYELQQCSTVAEMSEWIPKCMPSLNCDAMYLIIDPHMNDFRKEKVFYDRHLIDDEDLHGDWAIKTIAGAIMHNTPKGTIAARMGGDEFLFLLEGKDSEQIDRIIRVRRR